MQQYIDKVRALPCWQGEVDIAALSGGMTNHNFVVQDGGNNYVVRLGDDLPEHLLLRHNEAITSAVAAASGFSPAVIHRQAGVLVIDFIDGQVFTEADVGQPENLLRLVNLLQRFHRQMPANFNSYPMLFWVFQTLRHYRNMLAQSNSGYKSWLPELAAISATLEADVGLVDIVFCHNDLLAANFIDDGNKIWLIDFDYAGFNSSLFDLANLASNNQLDVATEQLLLQQYYQQPISEQRWQSYSAMKCASLLRELVWSMVSEQYSKVAFDYASYTREFQKRFDDVYARYLDNR